MGRERNGYINTIDDDITNSFKELSCEKKAETIRSLMQLLFAQEENAFDPLLATEAAL